ncbi:MAG: NusG domain II-containing protein [Mariprofundus sp.]
MSATLKGTRMDRALLLVCLVLVVGAWLLIQSLMVSGPAVAAVYHGKTLLATYPLPLPGQPDIHLEVEGELGLSDIVIDQDGARIASSPCRTQQCVLSGAHKHAGDMIACVPNRILITIRGRADSRFDAIVE